jgi:HAD superfamily hydrolase (TIGR01509 family)
MTHVPPKKTLCIIFDLDGTLVDSEVLCQQALLDLLPELDCPVHTLLDRYRGVHLDLILADLSNWARVRVPDDFELRYRARVATLFAKELQPMPGALAMLHAIEYPSCVASGGPIAKIRQSLSITGMDSHFRDRVFSSYEVGSWKPDPGLFLHAAEQMGFRPQDCLVVEDSAPGIEAAKRAGMRALHYVQADAGCCTATSDRLENLTDLPALLDALLAPPCSFQD